MGKRKEHHEEHPDERWLITYADVLTLMYVLFMVLFSISVVNTSKFEMLKESLSSAFAGNVADGGAGLLDGQAVTPQPAIVDGIPRTIAPEVPSINGPPSLLDANPAQALETRQLQEVEEQIDARVEAAGLSGSVETTVNERGLGIRVLTDDLLFASGTATLTGGAPTILGPVGSGIRELQNPVRVEGHTDSNPISTAAFPSNWELSGARASAVVRYLSGRGIATTRFQAVGLADTRPVATNASVSGRAANRRVEILVLRQQGAPSQSPADALGGTP